MRPPRTWMILAVAATIAAACSPGAGPDATAPAVEGASPTDAPASTLSAPSLDATPTEAPTSAATESPSDSGGYDY